MNSLPEDQIILIDKPTNISSFGVVAKVRAHLRDQFNHKIKVGHTGTLDPFATGLLILLTGKMTKKSNEFLKLDKTYEATLKLGFTSTTGDPEGEITPYLPQTKNNPESTRTNNQTEQKPQPTIPTELDVKKTLQAFIGKITQTPPKYSAIKINGQRAYKLARKDIDFIIPSREIEIYSIDIIHYDYPNLTIRTHVSSGTYIRTLAEDIGKALHTGAYLTALRRTTIGNYTVEKANPLDYYLPNSVSD